MLGQNIWSTPLLHSITTRTTNYYRFDGAVLPAIRNLHAFDCNFTQRKPPWKGKFRGLSPTNTYSYVNLMGQVLLSSIFMKMVLNGSRKSIFVLITPVVRT